MHNFSRIHFSCILPFRDTFLPFPLICSCKVIHLLIYYHDGQLAGHFSGSHLYKTLIWSWWWPHVNTVIQWIMPTMCHNRTGKRQKPLLQLIITEHPFQIVGVDVMELPGVAQGNQYIIILLYFKICFTNYPMVFPIPDQKTERIAHLLVEEVVPCFGVPEALLSDRRTNLLSFLMEGICKMLWIEKLNTTASHLQCNGAVERFNRTLKSVLRKHAAKFWYAVGPIH